MTLERVETKIDKLIETVMESTLEQAKTNVRHDMSIEENSQQTLNIATRLGEAESTQKANAPTIAFAANMSKLAMAIIAVVAGSWAIGSSGTPPDHVEPTTKKDKNDKN